MCLLGLRLQGSECKCQGWGLRKRDLLCTRRNKAISRLTFEASPNPSLRGLEYQGGGSVRDLFRCSSGCLIVFLTRITEDVVSVSSSSGVSPKIDLTNHSCWMRIQSSNTLREGDRKMHGSFHIGSRARSPAAWLTTHVWPQCGGSSLAMLDLRTLPAEPAVRCPPP